MLNDFLSGKKVLSSKPGELKKVDERGEETDYTKTEGKKSREKQKEKS